MSQCSQTITNLQTLIQGLGALRTAIISKETIDDLVHDRKAIQRMVEQLIEQLFISPAEAEKIMGLRFLGPKAVQKVWGITISESKMPTIKFTAQELELAKQTNQVLILRVNKTNKGLPMTLKQMIKIIGGSLQTKGFQPLWEFYDKDRRAFYETKEYYTKDTPEFEWALVATEGIQRSDGNNYLEQLRILVRFVKHSVMPTMTASKKEHYQKAIEEFEEFDRAHFKDKDRPEIYRMLKYQPSAREFALAFSKLLLVRLTQPRVIDALYDCFLITEISGREVPLYKHAYVWTRDVDNKGLILRGPFYKTGIGLGSHEPSYHAGSVYVGFCRLV